MKEQLDDKHTIKHHIEPEKLNNDAIDKETWQPQWHPLFVLADGGNTVAFIGSEHCLIHRSKGDSKWQYYHLPERVRFCTMGCNSSRLWFITNRSKLATFDFDSGDWLLFQHEMPYHTILYADKDNVIAQRYNMLAIDALGIQDEQLRRITSVDIPPLSFSHYVAGAAFLPGKNQFLVLDQVFHESIKAEYSVRQLSWDGKARTVLNAIEGDAALLRFPFAVILDKEQEELICCTLRRKSKLRWARFKLNFTSQRESYNWELIEAFPFGKGLVVVLEDPVLGERALLQLEHALQLLYIGPLSQESWSQERRNQYTLMGHFLISDEGFIYDLISRREVKEMTFSTLLRDGIVQQRPKRLSTKPVLTPTQEIGSSELDIFKVTLCDLPDNISEAAYSIPRFLASPSHHEIYGLVSSQKGDTACFVDGRVHLLLGGKGQVQRIKPELQSWWRGFTFDEQGRAWLYSKRGHYIAVITPDKKEGHGFVLSPGISNLLAAAAYYNNLALLFSDLLAFYHYDGRLLKEVSNVKVMTERPSWIKPETSGRGWWLASHNYSQGKTVLSYIEADAALIETAMEIPYQVKVLGDWPEFTYFIYVDDAHQLHYTFNPNADWRKVSLQGLLGEQTKSIHRVIPVSMHSTEGDVLLSVVVNGSSNAFLLMRLQTESASIISAFHQSTRTVRWGNWLVLYSHDSSSISLNENYTTLAEVDVLPQNEGVLFYHLTAGKFFAKPQPDYSAMNALGEFVMKMGWRNRSALKWK